MSKQTKSCPNLNHDQLDTQIRYCPKCGDVVNKNMPEKKCSDETHAQHRKNRNTYCVDCGELIIIGGDWL